MSEVPHVFPRDMHPLPTLDLPADTIIRAVGVAGPRQ